MSPLRCWGLLAPGVGCRGAGQAKEASPGADSQGWGQGGLQGPPAVHSRPGLARPQCWAEHRGVPPSPPIRGPDKSTAPGEAAVARAEAVLEGRPASPLAPEATKAGSPRSRKSLARPGCGTGCHPPRPQLPPSWAAKSFPAGLSSVGTQGPGPPLPHSCQGRQEGRANPGGSGPDCHGPSSPTRLGPHPWSASPRPPWGSQSQSTGEGRNLLRANPGSDLLDQQVPRGTGQKSREGADRGTHPTHGPPLPPAILQGGPRGRVMLSLVVQPAQPREDLTLSGPGSPLSCDTRGMMMWGRANRGQEEAGRR